MVKVLVSDVISQAGIEILEESGAEVIYDTSLSYEKLLKEIEKCDGIVVRSMTQLTEEVLKKAKNLKVIARAGSGYDNIDVDAASKLGIIVLNTPGQNTISASEQTMALMLAISKNITRANEAIYQKKWDRKKYMGVELNNKTLGIIGLGRIGSLVAKRAKSFNMEVIANDPYIPISRAQKLGVKLVEFEELLEKSDYITLHTPLTEETYHILSDKEFSKMKEGVRILNVARGKNVDHKALYNAIKSGKVGAAGIDVHEEEPFPQEYLLLELKDKVIMSPHLGGTTIEAIDNVSIDATKQLITVLQGGFPRTPLNIPSLEFNQIEGLRSYIDLAERLGAFYSGWLDSRIESIEVIYRGKIAKYNVQTVTTALLKGILNPILDEKINLVNAGLIAEQRGINIFETRGNTSDVYSNLITLKVRNGGECHYLSGTVFHEDKLRIVEIDGYQIDVSPEGILLVTSHIDKPGIVGSVGTLLGSNNINIASMQLGRNEVGGKAIMVLNIDQEIDRSVKQTLLDIEGMENISLLSL